MCVNCFGFVDICLWIESSFPYPDDNFVTYKFSRPGWTLLYVLGWLTFAFDSSKCFTHRHWGLTQCLCFYLWSLLLLLDSRCGSFLNILSKLIMSLGICFHVDSFLIFSHKHVLLTQKLCWMSVVAYLPQKQVLNFFNLFVNVKRTFGLVPKRFLKVLSGHDGLFWVTW